MADQKNRGGQKQTDPQSSGQSGRKRGSENEAAAERTDQERRKDQASNPDDAARHPTDQ